MWRFGYPNPVNYNDNELFCGGYAVQWEQNSGRCGVCGDAYHVKSPRPHEAGGEYAKGIISRYYTAGQEIDVEVELTANHYGRFEMYLCPNNNPRQEATQECFDRYPLFISGSREHRFLIPRDTKKKDIFRYRVRLPPYVTCTQCVLQWTYYTANMWGTCSNGTEAVGCGKAGKFSASLLFLLLCFVGSSFWHLQKHSGIAQTSLSSRIPAAAYHPSLSTIDRPTCCTIVTTGHPTITMCSP